MHTLGNNTENTLNTLRYCLQLNRRKSSEAVLDD